VVQRIGKPQARRLALLGMRFKGEEAQQFGIVHQVVDTVEALDAAVVQTLAQIKRCAPDANRGTKALIHRVGTEPLTDLLDDAAKQLARTVSVGEGVEGTMAFV
jgi:isohexenylglutaconyl-CoA hydratase